MEKIENNDFIRVNFTAKKSSTNEVFDTTDENKAKEAKIHNPKAKYIPALVVVGKGHIVKGVDEELPNLKVGEEKTVEVPVEKAYGARRPELVRLMPISHFRRNNIDPYPGLVLNLDGFSATVKSVNSGRVTLDMNHPLAGEKLIYTIKVVEKLKTDEEKVKALLEDARFEGTPVIEKTKLEVKVKGDALEEENYSVNKSLFVSLVKSLMPEFKKIIITEEYEAEEKEEKKA